MPRKAARIVYIQIEVIRGQIGMSLVSLEFGGNQGLSEPVVICFMRNLDCTGSTLDM